MICKNCVAGESNKNGNKNIIKNILRKRQEQLFSYKALQKSV